MADPRGRQKAHPRCGPSRCSQLPAASPRSATLLVCTASIAPSDGTQSHWLFVLHVLHAYPRYTSASAIVRPGSAVLSLEADLRAGLHQCRCMLCACRYALLPTPRLNGHTRISLEAARADTLTVVLVVHCTLYTRVGTPDMACPSPTPHTNPPHRVLSHRPISTLS